MVERIEVTPIITIEPTNTTITSFQLDVDGVSVLVICCCLEDPQEWEIRINQAIDMDNGVTLSELQVITASVTRLISQISGMISHINNLEESVYAPQSTPEFCQ